MKKMRLAAMVLLGVMVLCSPMAAEQIKKVAVLPFAINSPEKLDYLKDGVWDMLMSRIAVGSRIQVISKQEVLDGLEKLKKRSLAESDVQGLGQDLKVDYVVWGSITKIGDNVSLDGRFLDIVAKKSVVSVFEQSRGLNDVIPKINDFAKKVDQHILGEVPSTFAAAPAAPAGVPAAGAAAVAGGAAAAGPVLGPSLGGEAEVASRMRKGKGTFTAAINPDFIHSGKPDDRRGFWMSPKHSVEFRGMDIGDVNKDGLNEVVLIDSNSVMIYLRKGNDFVLLTKITGRKSDLYLSVDVADVNGNGVPEIFVTSYIEDRVDSFVLEYRDGKYEKIASGLPWFLRVINTTGTPVLLGQPMHPGNPFINPIHEIVWNDGKYLEGGRMKIPQGLSVYGLTIDTIEEGRPERIICLDSYDYLRVYEKTEELIERLERFGGAPELLYKSDDQFGGSNNSFEFNAAKRANVSADQERQWVYVNPRIITYDTNRDGKKEIILLKNLSATGRLLSRIKLFTSGEVYNIEWDGLGFVENWKTRKINGYIADYQVKDIDNDGRDEIVLALVLSVGPTIKSNSVVVSYRMTAQ